MPEASFIDNKHDLGTSYFGNAQEIAECNSQYISPNDSSEVFTPESIRRYLIIGYFLCELFFKTGFQWKI